MHRDPVLDASGYPYPGAAHFDQARPFRVDVDAEVDLHRAELVRPLAAIWSWHRRKGYLPVILSSKAVASQKTTSGMNTIRGVKGSAPGVMTFASSPKPIIQ